MNSLTCRSAVVLLCAAASFQAGCAPPPDTGDDAGGTSSSSGAASGSSSGAASGSSSGTASGSSSGAASGSSSGAASGSSSGTASGSSGGSATCPAGRNLSPGDYSRTIAVDGTQRTYLLHVPRAYTGTTAVPLVLDFHGLGGSGSQERSFSGYSRQSDTSGFIVAFPDGLGSTWNNGLGARGGIADDVGFAKAIVRELSAEGCIDARRVYAVGFSMGGGMTYYLACNAAEVFAAGAPSAFDLVQGQRCAPSRPISILSFRGTGDTVVPYEGKSTGSAFIGAEGTFDAWKQIDGCAGTPEAASDGCQLYRACDGGVEVGLCTIQGGGHAAGSAATGWEFLRQHVLP